MHVCSDDHKGGNSEDVVGLYVCFLAQVTLPLIDVQDQMGHNGFEKAHTWRSEIANLQT